MRVLLLSFVLLLNDPQRGNPDTMQNQGIPPQAFTRLQELRGGQGRPGLFTSDLSVNEFLLIKEAGFDPVGLVVGSSIYHIGFQYANMTQNQELGVLTQAMYAARELAMSRMEAEADALGADGIVGVRLAVGQYTWGENLAEFMAIGTAVRSQNGISHRTPQGKPFTSDLSGQDFRTLLSAGYRPVSLVMGTCVYHIGVQGIRQWFSSTMGQNVEMSNYTQGLYEARELAMARMQAEAESVGANGIVGVRIEEKSYGWDSHVIEYFAIGTAIIATEAEKSIPAPQLILSMNDPA
jgi:uncharacterized protein YbjQ (UPF0145 family)